MAVWVAKLALLVLLASADHIIVGVPPVITSQQEDVVVSSDVLANGSEANLVLSCEAAGDPTPSIAWFMEGNPVPAEFVLSDGRLVRNVTDGFGASQAGTTYYCTATNSIGPGNSLPATVRSRDIIVTYTFFNGFRNNTIRTVQLQTAVGGAVAMECDFLEASPRPRIQWFMNNGTFPIAEEMDQDEVLFVEEGRFLFIRVLTAHQRNSSFHCEVVNAFLGTQPQRSPITYTLGGDIPPNDLEIYIGDRSVTAIIGEPVRVVYAAARSSPGTNHVTCSYPGVEIVVTSGVVVTFTVSDELRQPLNLNCSVLVDVDFTTVMYTFKIAQPAYISAPAMGAASLTDRERLVGGGPVMFQCENQGIPAPMVTWYHNGETIQPDSGVGVNMVISEPQVSNSGVYQCVVSNTIDGVVREDRRQWVLEVREPMSPVITDLTATNPMAASDRIEGTVIVADSGTPNVTVVVEVASDPCPEVQWSINGTNINDSANYFINNPCGANSSLYNFTITIANLTLDTSGQYSAVFSHLAGSTTLPGLYVTVPVDVQVLGLTLMVEGDDQVQCLSKGQNVTLTCDIYGFPRLGIVFRRDLMLIPGGENFERITKISSDQIQITEVIRTDAGCYSCEIGNAMPANLNLTFCSSGDGPNLAPISVVVVVVLVHVVLVMMVVLFIRCRKKAPGPVSNLQVTTPTATTLTITWTVSGFIDRFEVTYCLTVNGSSAPQGAPHTETISSSMRSCTLSNLNEDSNYTISVRAINTAGSTMAIITADTPPSAPGPVNNLQVTTPTATTLTIDWTVSGSIDRFEVTYNLTVNRSSAAPHTDTISGSMRSHTLRDLNEDSNYTITVRAINTAGSTMAIITADTPPSAPGPVNNLQVTTPTATTLPITWTVSGSIDQFEVTYSLTVNGSSAPQGAPRTDTISDGSMRSHTLSNLNDDSNYTITVRAINTAGSTMATITADTPPSVTSIEWKKEPHGDYQIGAFGKRDVLIIRTSDESKSLVGPAISRRKGTLTSEDKRKLTSQGISEDYCGDDVQLMEARYRKDAERFDTIIKCENESRDYTMKRIRDVMNETDEPGVVIHYIGPGKKDTGDWCFADGNITFEDIKEAYNECFRSKSKCLEITCDCSYSGKWVSDCRNFLNATKVMGCGHSAAKKRVFMKVKTSCRSDQIPHTLLYSARGWKNTSTGDLFQKYKYEVGQDQNLRYLDNTVVRCKQGLTIEDPCEKNYDWHKEKHLLKLEMKGKPAWQVLLVEDQDQLGGAQVLKTKYGEPPEEVVKEIDQWNKRKASRDRMD